MSPLILAGGPLALNLMQSDGLSARPTLDASKLRLQMRIVGVVQGVGFRPFVYRLANEMGLPGWVLNDGDGVAIEVEGTSQRLARFIDRVKSDKPPPAVLYAWEHRFLPPSGMDRFEIRKSESQGLPKVWVLPDLALCRACCRDIQSGQDRRYCYPFTNCTHCGPRFTIIDSLPYDRAATSMGRFRMCPACQREYQNPDDRRFHAQPNACPNCGPQAEFCDKSGRRLAGGIEALRLAAEWLKRGRIIALKGLGGFHLMVEAANEQAVAELRRRKRRPSKAFALMYPGLEQLARHVEMPPYAESLLTSPQAPILLLSRTPLGEKEVASSVAPASPYLGVFLPYTPLHRLLLNLVQGPLVATSGNASDEPIQFRNSDALRTLAPLCDAFLIHDRPIVRPADDSVVRILARPQFKPQMLRRARGYVPLPLLSPRPLPPLLALGGHLNATFALSREREIILSQHLCDMETYEARRGYEEALRDFLRLFEVQPQAVVHDQHPDYFTTRLAARLSQEWEVPRIAIQHHHAHLAACMAENQLEGTVLGLIWDGAGYGQDATVWGGEFLMGSADGSRRVATLWPFLLPGSERAVREPWRVALSLLWESLGDSPAQDLPLFGRIPSDSTRGVLQILRKRVMAPETTSMGRLFDGVSALLNLSLYNTHQAQSAQLLEYAAGRGDAQGLRLRLPLRQEEEVIRLDWREMVRDLLSEQRRGRTAEDLAAAFHRALAEAAVESARHFACRRVVMAGGVFCNRVLSEQILARLEEAGFEPYIHSQLPPTDASLSLGQLWAAAEGMRLESPD